jgi:hypothetical protein
LRPDAGLACHAKPFFDVGMHHLGKLLRAVARGLKALLEEPALFNATLERFLATAEADRWPLRDPAFRRA